MGTGLVVVMIVAVVATVYAAVIVVATIVVRGDDVTDRTCVDCGQPGQFPVFDDTCHIEGWLCSDCERKRRRRRLGWKRRAKRRVRRLFKL